MVWSKLRRNRLFAGLFAVILATTGIAAGAAGPASAGQGHSSSSRTDYVALGDSYAAGQGGGEYLDRCLHTAVSYPRRLDAVDGVRLIKDATCAGQTTADLLQVLRLRPVKQALRRAELVTITTGVNDLLSEDILESCDASETARSTAEESDACTELVAEAIGDVKHRLFKALVKLVYRAPRATVVVTGYPFLFHEPTDPFHIRIDAAIGRLNAALQRTVEKAQLFGAEVQYVDVTGIFAGHNIGTPFPFLHADGPDKWHPNADGHGAYFGRVALALGLPH